MYVLGQTLFDLNDLILINDLAVKLFSRYDYLHERYPYLFTLDEKRQLNAIQKLKLDIVELDKIKKYNVDCLSKIDEILEKIDWRKYS
jgi:hypothetical protein